MKTTLVHAEVDLADGSNESIDPSALMEPLRFSTALPTLNFVLGSEGEGELSEEATEWLKDRVRTVSGRDDVTSLRVCWEPVTIDISTAQVADRGACEWKTVRL
ncbi:hypothetical protein AB1K56_10370 [Microbacterium sp. BWR-S6Y]|uniref:hypothetical protein n=1 Tax=Microbacterium sp. BWR-S6Y TaxID=3232073 RepID=UPI003527955A